MLSLHVIGLAVVVGIFSMRDMRLLGMFKGLKPVRRHEMDKTMRFHRLQSLYKRSL